jgi:hypothetical protein
LSKQKKAEIPERDGSTRQLDKGSDLSVPLQQPWNTVARPPVSVEAEDVSVVRWCWKGEGKFLSANHLLINENKWVVLCLVLTVPEAEARDPGVLIEGWQRLPDDADGLLVRVGTVANKMQASPVETVLSII